MFEQVRAHGQKVPDTYIGMSGLPDVFLSPSLPKISYPIEGTVTRTDVAFYFMPGAEQWYKYQSHKYQSRFARWFIFKPNIPIWVYYGGPCIFYGHLV
jgi:hypothetical protein